MVAIKQIKLTNLLINTENYRFIPVLGQRKAIEQMVEDQGDKLYKLAEHISKNGLNPNDKVQVAPSSHEAPKFNVLEGNRRIVVLKILHNPDLLDFDGQASLRKRFRNFMTNTNQNVLLTLNAQSTMILRKQRNG